tara:strand:- start:566 stop:715 length:150 start_codon:yes stop_codon:yes gene_type:complete
MIDSIKISEVLHDPTLHPKVRVNNADWLWDQSAIFVTVQIDTEKEGSEM